MRKTKDQPIPRISRKEALASGSLIDVSAAARDAGFAHPMAFTRLAWDRYVRVPHGAFGDTEDGRLRSVLEALRSAVERAEPREKRVYFSVWLHDGDEMQRCGLRAVGERGDDREVVITVMDSLEQ